MKHAIIPFLCLALMVMLLLPGESLWANFMPFLFPMNGYSIRQHLYLNRSGNHEIPYRYENHTPPPEWWGKREDFPWKQVGIYGLEFLGAEMGNAPTVALAYLWSTDDYSRKNCMITYTVGNMLLTSTSCWITGKLLKQEGTWPKTAIGTALGTIFGNAFAYNYSVGTTDELSLATTSVMLFFPAAGAVVGFNF